jgi:hypothetical protein
LKRLSNAARASLGERTAAGCTPCPGAVEDCEAPSRITVTFGVNKSHSFALSL